MQHASHVNTTTNYNSLHQQLLNDINTWQIHFDDAERGLKVLSFKADISLKTLKRYLAGKGHPQKCALFRLYDTFLKEGTLKFPPENVKKHLPQLEVREQDLLFDLDIKKELKRNTLFRKIYLLSIAKNFYRQEVSYRFGTEGEKIMGVMIKRGILKETTGGLIGRGEERLEEDSSLMQIFIIDLITDHFHSLQSLPSPNRSIACLFASLNKDGAREMMAIDEWALIEKKKVLNNGSYQGDIPLWSATITSGLHPS